METKDLLDEALQKAINDLKNAKPGTEEYSSIEKTVKELFSALIEYDKCSTDYNRYLLEEQAKEAQSKLDNDRLEFEKKKLEEDKKMFKQNQVSQMIKQGCEITGAAIGGITMMSLVKALVDIEKTGVPTSKVWQLIFRNIRF